MNAASIAGDGNTYRLSPWPRNASHSSPSSRQRGAHSVSPLPAVRPSWMGMISAATDGPFTTGSNCRVSLSGLAEFDGRGEVGPFGIRVTERNHFIPAVEVDPRERGV